MTPASEISQDADIIVVGAGIAGASAAAELSAYARVLLLDMESHPGFHSTGRSAAFFSTSYGNRVVRGITAASEHFFRSPPPGFTDIPLIGKRDLMYIGRSDQTSKLEALHAENPLLQPLSVEEMGQVVPLLSPPRIVSALLDVHGGDLDVDALLQAYLRLFRQRGGTRMMNQRISSLHYLKGKWELSGSDTTFSAPVLVNAAGAWADQLAQSAGLSGMGITSMRRTAALIDPPEGMDIHDWPLVVDASEEFYFKPDAGKLLISPADETPSDPCDAQATELDIAIAADRFHTATGLEPRRICHRWAGLRNFAPDRAFVVGWDPRVEGFFWLAGQGGYGIQSAPGLAQLATALLTGSQLATEFQSVLDYSKEVSPERLIAA